MKQHLYYRVWLQLSGYDTYRHWFGKFCTGHMGTENNEHSSTNNWIYATRMHPDFKPAKDYQFDSIPQNYLEIFSIETTTNWTKGTLKRGSKNTKNKFGRP